VRTEQKKKNIIRTPMGGFGLGSFGSKEESEGVSLRKTIKKDPGHPSGASVREKTDQRKGKVESRGSSSMWESNTDAL